MRVSPQMAKRLTTVFACVAKKATAIAMLPCKIYTDDGHGGTKVARKHPLYQVLYVRPNHLQTAFEFRQMMQQHVELRGNAYAEKIPGPRGPVDQLWPMHPDRVTVEQLQGSGKMRYKYADPLTGTTRILMQEEVFHLRWNPDVMGLGQSRISHGCDMLGLGLSQQEYRARFIQNDATPGVFVTGANYKKVEDEDAFVSNLQRSRTKENRGRPFLLPPGVDIKSLSVTPADQQLLESIKATDVQICTLFDILPHLVGIDAGKAATFASTEEFNLMHVQYCVLPMVIMWEQAIQRDLITSDAFWAKFSLASLLRGDQETTFECFASAVGSGIMCPDEARELLEMNPIPGGLGKKFWRQANWAPLDVTTIPNGSQYQGDASDQDDDDEDDDAQTGMGGEDDDEEAQASVVRMSPKERKAFMRSVATDLVEHLRRRAA
jgi:HK97 family phage portal protein